MKLPLIEATLRLNVICGLLAASIGAYCGFLTEGLSFCLGTLWSSLNLFFIKILLRLLLTSAHKNYWKISSTLIIKIPILYFVGYGLMNISMLSRPYFLMGLSLIFCVILALGCLQTLFSPLKAGENEVHYEY